MNIYLLGLKLGLSKQSQASGQVVNRAVKGIFKPLKRQQKHDPMGPLTDALNHMQDADATTNHKQDAGNFAKKKDRKSMTSVAAGY